MLTYDYNPQTIINALQDGPVAIRGLVAGVTRITAGNGYTITPQFAQPIRCRTKRELVSLLKSWSV